MSFERVFESRANRAVMIGLFLALLELVREKLVWVEQPGPSARLYLRPLTDEPAEQAVQRAILVTAAETNNKQPPTKQQGQPSVPITKLPTKSKAAVLLDAQQREQPSIPIAELSPRRKSAVSLNEKEEIKPAENHK